jgi:hypothetical protein
MNQIHGQILNRNMCKTGKHTWYRANKKITRMKIYYSIKEYKPSTGVKCDVM